MLRSVLGAPKSDSDGKLIQLAESTNGEDAAGDSAPLAGRSLSRPTSDSSMTDHEEEAQTGPPPGAESVITQVNSVQGARGSAISEMVTLPGNEDDGEARGTWRSKVRYGKGLGPGGGGAGPPSTAPAAYPPVPPVGGTSPRSLRFGRVNPLLSAGRRAS